MYLAVLSMLIKRSALSLQQTFHMVQENSPRYASKPDPTIIYTF